MPEWQRLPILDSYLDTPGTEEKRTIKTTSRHFPTDERTELLPRKGDGTSTCVL